MVHLFSASRRAPANSLKHLRGFGCTRVHHSRNRLPFLFHLAATIHYRICLSWSDVLHDRTASSRTRVRNDFVVPLAPLVRARVNTLWAPILLHVSARIARITGSCMRIISLISDPRFALYCALETLVATSARVFMIPRALHDPRQTLELHLQRQEKRASDLSRASVFDGNRSRIFSRVHCV